MKITHWPPDVEEIFRQTPLAVIGTTEQGRFCHDPSVTTFSAGKPSSEPMRGADGPAFQRMFPPSAVEPYLGTQPRCKKMFCNHSSRLLYLMTATIVIDLRGMRHGEREECLITV
jgi:hypothetical protein